MFVREAHPGSRYRAHTSGEQKAAYAREFKDVEGIPWPILVDDLSGTVHRAYGQMPDNVFLIDRPERLISPTP